MPWCNLRWHLPLPHQSCVLRWIAVFCDVTRLVLGVLGNAMLTWAGVVGGVGMGGGGGWGWSGMRWCRRRGLRREAWRSAVGLQGGERCEGKLVWEDRSWAGPAWLKMLLGLGGWGRGWVGAAKPTLGSLGGNT